MEIINGKVHDSKRVGVDSFAKLIKEIAKEHGELFATPDLFYTGYPLLATPDGTESLDAMILTIKYGIIAFDIVEAESISSKKIKDRQDAIYNQIFAKLATYQDLMAGRELAFHIEVISVVLFRKVINPSPGLTIIEDKSSLEKKIVELMGDTDNGIEDALFRKLKSIIQAVSTLKPINKRVNAKTPGSKGSLLKEIERQVANLDLYQNKAIIETTKSPQRITGLAGTGKTIVLAGKAAYLHSCDPNLDIVVTFYSQSLYQQYRELIRRFYYEYLKDEPNWEKINILHSWGGQYSRGLYQAICEKNKISPYSYRQAVDEHGQTAPFEHVCNDLLKNIKNKPVEAFDVILIDEAQDMPRSFFELCYLSTRDPHRVVWAYDELQQLNTIETVSPPEILFGKKDDGSPRFKFKENNEGPDDDIMLKVCYRSPKEIITTAHAIGLAVYFEDGPIQMIEDRNVWERIGYEVEGTLQAGEKVSIKRSSETSPEFLSDKLKGDDIIKCEVFDDKETEAKWIANEIKENLEKNELHHTDILVVYPYAYTMRTGTAALRAALLEKGINNHIAGADEASEFFMVNSIAISHIHRAKGNEAAIVYIMDAHKCAVGDELINKRNILFTAISRARAWVRVCGIGKDMKVLKKEIETVATHRYQLEFTFPTDLEKRRRLHRDLTSDEKYARTSSKKSLDTLLANIKSGKIDPSDLPEKEINELMKYLKKHDK